MNCQHPEILQTLLKRVQQKKNSFLNQPLLNSLKVRVLVSVFVKASLMSEGMTLRQITLESLFKWPGASDDSLALIGVVEEHKSPFQCGFPSFTITAITSQNSICVMILKILCFTLRHLSELQAFTYLWCSEGVSGTIWLSVKFPIQIFSFVKKKKKEKVCLSCLHEANWIQQRTKHGCTAKGNNYRK